MDNWDLLLSFVETIISSFDVGIDKLRVGVVKFSTTSTLIFDLDDYFDSTAMKSRVRNMDYDGGYTNTYAGLRTLRRECFGAGNGDRPDVPNIAIVVTDGVPTLEMNRTQPEADRVKNAGIFIMGVGITNQIDEKTLR